jgi:hypothetical protein
MAFAKGQACNSARNRSEAIRTRWASKKGEEESGLGNCRSGKRDSHPNALVPEHNKS